MEKVKEILGSVCNKVKYIFLLIRVSLSKKKLVCVDKNLVERYEDLAPIDKLNNTSEYFKALDWAFNNPNIFNIAIAGPYGSGKSSIIKSYIKKHPELKNINISLANFIEMNEEGTPHLSDFEKDKLEVGILKQLFYKVDFYKIPQSRYRKLHTISKGKICVYTFIITALTICGMIFLIPNLQGHLETLISNATGNLEKISKKGYMLLEVY